MASGEFQDETETFIADEIPMRDHALLANAALQRMSITLAAASCGYDVYLTFFGSNRYYAAAVDAIIKFPDELTEERLQGYRDTALWINKIAAAHPTMRIVVCNASDREYENYGINLDSAKQYIDAATVERWFCENLDERIISFAPQPGDTDTAPYAYYRSDHHWETAYAYQVYCACLRQLDPRLEPASITSTHTWSEPAFLGTHTRKGLMPLRNADQITDIAYEASSMRVTYDGKPSNTPSFTRWEEYSVGTWATDTFASRYEEYFLFTRVVTEFENTAAPRNETLVVVSNSMDNPIERLFAESYHHVYCINLRTGDFTLREFLASHDADCLLFIAADHTYSQEEIARFLS